MNWELRRDKDGVQVYTAAVSGSSFKAVKATTRIDAPVEELVALVRDVDACGEWAAFCAQAAVVSEASETDLLIYTLNDMPWPVSDREALTRVVWNLSSEGAEALDTAAGQITMRATVVDGESLDLAERWRPKKGKVRLSYGVTQWTFAPNGQGQINVSSYAHIDPGGAVPAWLTNRLLVDAPFDTIVGMRDLVATGRYKGATFEFLNAP